MRGVKKRRYLQECVKEYDGTMCTALHTISPLTHAKEHPSKYNRVPSHPCKLAYKYTPPHLRMALVTKSNREFNFRNSWCEPEPLLKISTPVHESSQAHEGVDV